MLVFTCVCVCVCTYVGEAGDIYVYKHLSGARVGCWVSDSQIFPYLPEKTA